MHTYLVYTRYYDPSPAGISALHAELDIRSVQMRASVSSCGAGHPPISTQQRDGFIEVVVTAAPLDPSKEPAGFQTLVAFCGAAAWLRNALHSGQFQRQWMAV